MDALQQPPLAPLHILIARAADMAQLQTIRAESSPPSPAEASASTSRRHPHPAAPPVRAKSPDPAPPSIPAPLSAKHPLPKSKQPESSQLPQQTPPQATKAEPPPHVPPPPIPRPQSKQQPPARAAPATTNPSGIPPLQKFRRNHHQRTQQIMQLVLIAHIGPYLRAHLRNSLWRKPSRLAQQRIRQPPAHRHRRARRSSSGASSRNA